jgi:protein involved in polysaccharide export with SLBB domain
MGSPRIGFWACRGIAGLATLAGLAVSGGCLETDAWMGDPSKVGRWERTVTSTPILSRLASIEGPEDQFVQYSEPQPEDLIPEAFEYRITAGDTLLITTLNFPREGEATQYPRIVDTRGMISLPQLGQLQLSGQTIEGAKAVIADAMRAAQLGANPIVDISLSEQRMLRFSVLGAVYRAGPYQIPAADFRVLEAITAAGGPVENIMARNSYITVIRQIPLEERVTGEAAPAPAPDNAKPAPGGEHLIDNINDLSKPPAPPPPAGENPPAAQPPAPSTTPAVPPGSPGVLATNRPAPIPLIDQPRQPEGQPRTESPPPTPGDTWIMVNGKWVRAGTPGNAAADGGQPALKARNLVTQRVIRIPVIPLLSGDARYNIVVRPGDVITVPTQPTGFVFIGGEVNRAGTYGLSEQLTLSAAITAAGGLNSIAFPERVYLTRHIGNDRLATIRLNYRAIQERTYPDIYL